ncbi:hypothetical protein UlMin_021931 [Ulmus minor]
MKGGQSVMGIKELSLITIILMCTTVLILTWKKTPLLMASPSQISPDVLVIPQVDNLGEYKGTFAVKESENDETEIEEIGEEENQKTAAAIGSIQRSPSSSEISKENDAQKMDSVSLVGSANTSISVGGKNRESLTSHGENQACNYANGKWVVDINRSLYSGSGCKRWLAPMWACRLTQRPDFSFETLRWQPKDCQMEEFEGSKFLKKLQDKTLAFVGDSLGRQQFQSLMCMITGGEERNDVIDVGNEYGFVEARGHARPGGWAFRFPSTNTTILFYWSSSLCDIEPIDKGNPETFYAMHLDRPAAFLQQFIHKFHVLVLNTGHHWNRGKVNTNRWVMHVGGVPNTDKNIQIIWRARNLTIHSVVQWLNSQLPKYPNLKVFYRTISPRHFVGGDWNTGGSCDNTTPMSIGKEVIQDESSDSMAASAVKGTGVKLLDITGLSQLRDEAHMSRFRSPSGGQDCLHWCLPGVPDTWNELLFTQI